MLLDMLVYHYFGKLYNALHNMCVCLKLRGSLSSSLALNNRMVALRSELEDLERKERMLDQQRFWVEQSIRNTTEDCSKYPYFSKTMQGMQD